MLPCSSYRESLELSLSYTSGNFHYRTWLVYSDDGLPQNALGLREQANWMHTHLVSFVELSYTYRSSASVAWQSLLTHMDIYYGHLHSPLIHLFDVRPSSSFCLLHITPIIIFYSTHSAISMAHAHILREDWKSLRTSKVWNNCLAETRVVHDLNILCDEYRA